LRLPLQGQRLDGLDQHRVPDEAVRLFADQDLAGARRGLQPLRDRDGLPGRKRLALARISGNDLARVDAAPHSELDAVLGTKLLVELGRAGKVGEDDRDRLAHLACDGTLREGSATGEAEPGAGGIRLATAGTGGHVPSDSRTEQVAEYTGGRVRRPLRQASDG